jgi:DNA-binding MarR family transcriptional regulator
MESPQFFDEHSTPIDQRLATGLFKLGLAVKHHERQAALEAGLSPTQAQILILLAAKDTTSPSDLSDSLGVSLPTVSDSVSALVAKRFVKRRPSPSHHKATILTLTRAGRVEARRAMRWPEFLATAIGTLSDTQQENLLTILVRVLGTLQADGQIPMQRMCVTCTFFRPNVHTGARPHHCAFVDAPMGPTHLRLVCDEHEMASSEAQTAQWQQFLQPAV